MFAQWTRFTVVRLNRTRINMEKRLLYASIGFNIRIAYVQLLQVTQPALRINFLQVPIWHHCIISLCPCQWDPMPNMCMYRYRGVRRHGLIMGCSVTGKKEKAGPSPLDLGPKAEDIAVSQPPCNPTHATSWHMFSQFPTHHHVVAWVVCTNTPIWVYWLVAHVIYIYTKHITK